MFAAFLAGATFIVVCYINFGRPAKRFRELERPVSAYFVIPAKADHGCEFASQDDEEHRVKKITLPTNSEVIVDLVLNPRLHFIASEVYFGCWEDTNNKRSRRPYAMEYLNRFIETGARRHIIPGQGNSHEIDKHHFYHVKDPSQWSIGDDITVGFKMITYEPGVFPVRMFFRGDAREGKSDDLIIHVEGYPQARMPCVRPEHAHMACAVGIPPRIRQPLINHPL
jgi:hypothetical protein